ncbi:zinc-binding dehydrogenase [Alphaproteobacteria bacterium]|nr:zinc-binding dehydrogenase [Alphaproteobacteria bacterium]
MKAVTLGSDGVEIKELAEPKPSQNQVLVKVKSCGLNRSDLLETQGQSFGHTGGDTKIIGGEFAGEIVELGEGVEDLKVGDKVMCRGGSGWAEYAAANHKRAIKFNPEEISWEQAASIQGNLQTMHDAIVTNGKFISGQSVFIQGASSGVGIIGLQIAKALGASLVLGSSTNQNKLSKLSSYGADILIDTSKENWLDKVLNVTEGKGVDVLIDMLSGDFVNKNMEATKINGHLINIGRLAGMNGNFNYDLHAKRRLHYVGTTGRTRSIEENLKVAKVANNDLWKYVINGKIRHVIFKTFSLVDANSALNLMNENKHFGKLVLLTNQ